MPRYHPLHLLYVLLLAGAWATVAITLRFDPPIALLGGLLIGVATSFRWPIFPD